MAIDQKIAESLKKRAEQGDKTVLRSAEFRSLFDAIKTLPNEEKKEYGKSVNNLRSEIESILQAKAEDEAEKEPLDITAPFDVNVPKNDQPKTLLGEKGSMHPLMRDEAELLDIFSRMGFSAVDSRQIDDDYHMFTSLNFPEGHPARDDYDTFQTEEGYIAPAHTSTMQNRVLKKNKHLLDINQPIATVIAGRVFRNQDVDARHEHTFQQIEGVFVDKGVHAGMLIATLKTFLQEYYKQELEVKTQPFYFPFTEPSFEFAMSCPFCQKKGCSVCSRSGWIEILGCGMIHPNVLEEAGIDPKEYTGFAWGVGTIRLTMMKYGIEDIRHFSSGKLDFLRQFS